jgi:DNA-binding LacI/PurR family transcriptional regulator
LPLTSFFGQIFMPTLQDVAEKAGVSTATVSKVLSNTPYFTEATRRKVMHAVEELGYVPNLPARALSGGKTHIIAVAFPYVYEAIFTDPLVMRILEGVEAECTQRGYNILLSTPLLSAEGPDEHYLNLIRSGYLEGILTIDNVPLASAYEPARKRGIPGVVLGYHHAEFFVRSDDVSGGLQIMNHILELGHRHIGIISVPEVLHYSIYHRLDGMRAAAARAGLDFDALPKANGDFSVASGQKCTAQLLSQHPGLTALVCLNDRMAMGAIRQAHEMGRRVPENLTIVGYDDIPMAGSFAPPLTTIDQQALELGRAGARMLFEVLDNQKPAPIHVPTHLVVRQSAAPPA